MNARILFLSVLFEALCLLLTGQTSMEVINPKPSYKTGIDVHFVSEDIGYIINEDQLLETTDQGTTWNVRQSLTIAFDIDFYNATGYICGYNGYLLKTTDGGATWEELPPPVYENFNTVNVINEMTVILSTFDKLVKSTDGGNEWTILPISDVTVIRTFFVSYQVGHAACTNGTMLKTVNGGNDWFITAETNTSPSSYLSIFFINENTGFASREPSELYKTTDGGETWFALQDFSIPVRTIFFINENTGFISLESGYIYKTLNGGNYWFQSGPENPATFRGIYFTDGNHGFATGDNGKIIKTSTSGISWEQYSTLYSNIRQLQFVNSEKGYLLTENDFYQTTDGGYHWEYQGSPAHYEYSGGFQFIDENTGFSFGSGQSSIAGSVFKTTDGGKNWTKLNGGNQVLMGAIYSGFFISENVGIVSGNSIGSQTMKTTNGGSTWFSIGDYAFNDIQFVSENTGFSRTTGWYSRIYKSTDAGETWEIIFETDEGVNAFDFVNDTIGYLTGDNGLMYKTEDGGESWIELDIPWEYYIAVKFYNENIGYILDEDGSIYKTDDGGQVWHWLTQVYGIKDFEIFNSYVYPFGSFGIILRSPVTANTGTNEFDALAPELQIFPNPAKSFITFCSSSGSGIQYVEVFDLQGRLLVSKPGSDNKSVSLDINDLKRGLHIFKIILRENKIVSGKFLCE